MQRYMCKYAKVHVQVCKGTCASMQRYMCKYAKVPKRSGNCNTELANSLLVIN